jgi:hypothetical protein
VSTLQETVDPSSVANSDQSKQFADGTLRQYMASLFPKQEQRNEHLPTSKRRKIVASTNSESTFDLVQIAQALGKSANSEAELDHLRQSQL